MVHKKEEGTYHRIEKLTKEMPGFLSPGDACLSYSGIKKEQRIHDRSKTVHRKQPPVKCFLTALNLFDILKNLFIYLTASSL